VTAAEVLPSNTVGPQLSNSAEEDPYDIGGPVALSNGTWWLSADVCPPCHARRRRGSLEVRPKKAYPRKQIVAELVLTDLA